MMHHLILLLGLFVLGATTNAFGQAQGTAAVPQCVEDKIAIQKLTQQNAQLLQQLMQTQFQASQKAAEEAKVEQARLEKLLPKKSEEKSKPPATSDTTQ